MAGASIKIPAELFATAESSHFEGAIAVPELQVGPDTYRFAEPLPWSVDVTNTGSAFLVMGTVSGVGEAACSRCLEPVAYDFSGDIEGYFLMDEEDAAAFEGDEDAPGEDEFDLLPADHIIDLEPLILAALIVDAPSLPLCDEGCEGLCPVCGADLNRGPCGCGKADDVAEFDKAANPFSVLADYDFSDN